ncbi:PREDICTED: uncharacterized protein LOC105950071 [Erythranthe guttata]|uniref:uncharacterized protein LOC105950071 n=1 Tax=Erythranthe guttata TaxID=4155 RepID=UPI00064DD310|nr:PREDICTED: uncharacterized protein LOC105950071 [Erythranthe guttata]|eukprot:XP_012828844.1 PREDICTED: uncharacterized protein LOC105950071 [Erythranthe guttata]
MTVWSGPSFFSLCRPWDFPTKCATLCTDLSPTFGTHSINGATHGHFKSSRGVRQGDPLSPLIFIITQEILTLNIKHLEEQELMKMYKVRHGSLSISHLFYADDMLLFTNESKRLVQALRNMLHKYEASSGHLISLEKNSFYTSKGLDARKFQKIKEWSGCSHKNMPPKYLGVPIYKGPCLVKHFDYLVQQVQNRLEGWQSEFLNFGGHIIFVKLVLYSLPNHTLSSDLVPKQVLDRMERLFCKFLWGKQDRKGIN